MNTGPLGSELTKEPFRWDQRLFAIVLALSANTSSIIQTGNPGNPIGVGIGVDAPANQFIPAAIDQPITAMCDVTGGKLNLIILNPKICLNFFRSIVFNNISTNTSSMFRIPCTKNSNRCCG
jgi:integrator complex subunit 6